MTMHNLLKEFTMFSTSTMRLASGALLAAVVLALPVHAADPAQKPAAAKQKAAAPKQMTYASPEEAVQALIAAAKAADPKGMIAILGAGSKPLVDSGDAVSDKERRARFVASYDEASKLERSGDAKAILTTGKDAWPFPIPLVKDAAGWRFDTAAGKAEILNRRIGSNELSTIQSMLAYVDAQRDYYRLNPQKDKLQGYAQKLVSSKGKRDGLYYPTKAGEPLSPLGPLFDAAKAKGYGGTGAKATAYHGYHYRILKGQGADASGGAYDYMAKGKMIGGFALIAWPATYRNSGVMTFMVNHDGVVFEKDLGPNTASVAGKITRFNPDSSWRRQ
ncbi:MAG: hypothetical protein RJA24_1350 [Pseudomonadota bacterium]